MSSIDPMNPHGVQRPGTAPSLDWGIGAYEKISAPLVPAAETVVEASDLRVGERVLDVGCGTGNLALIAASIGARVTGVDPAGRLLDVARAAARQHDLDIEFLLGKAEALPVPDDSQDAVLSNFGVIFAREPETAITEMIRVLRPDGRIVFSAWIPSSLNVRYVEVANAMVSEALGSPRPPAPFPWHDAASLNRLIAARGMSAVSEEHELMFTAASPEEYLEADRVNHPMAILGYQVLQRAGLLEAAQARLLQLLREGNEDERRFRSTNQYAVVTARTDLPDRAQSSSASGSS